MRKGSFVVLQLLSVAVGLTVLWRQQATLRDLRSEKTPMAGPSASPSFRVNGQPRESVSDPSPTAPARPSVELLQLRAEVSRLRAEWESLTPQAQASMREADEWNRVWEGPKPSDRPGFRRFSDLAPEGWATPEAAYGSFQHAFRNQSTNALTSTRMKEIFLLPDDFDDPKARYSINMGAGMQGIGYRITQSELVEPGQVKLTLEIENANGTSFREERTLIQSNGRWRIKPEGLQRMPDLPADAPVSANDNEVRTRSEPVLLP